MKNNSNIFERMMQIAKSEGIKNVPELASVMGYKGSEKLYRLQRDANAKPSLDIIEDFSNKFENLDLHWLITGDGEMFKNSGDTPVLSNQLSEPEVKYSASTPNATKRVTSKKQDKIAPPTAPPTNVLTTVLNPKYIVVDNEGEENIPFVGVRVAAGYLNGHADKEYMETLPTFKLPGLRDGTFRAFEVSGNSMSPTLEDKEMVIGKWVEKLDHIRDDRVHIVVTKNDGIVIKRLLNRINEYGFILAKSDAISKRDEYPNIEIYPENILEVWYAQFHGGFNFKSPAEVYTRVNNVEADIQEIMRVLKEHDLLKK